MCIALAALLAASATSAASLPAGYTQYSYIESTGTGKQYIDTGFKPDVNTRADYHFYMNDFKSWADWATPFGSRNGGSCQFFAGAARQGTRNDWYRRFSNKNDDNASGYAGKPSVVGEHFFSLNGPTYTLDDYTSTFSGYATFAKTYNAYVFAVNNNNAADQHAPIRLYSLKIWDDGTLARDFVPCTDENGKPGLYDTVGGQMYYNMASGADFLFGYEGTPCDLSCAQTNGVWYATTSLWGSSGEVRLHVVSPQGATNVVALSNGVAAAPATFTTAIPGVAADTVYSAFASIVSGVDTNVTQAASFFNGPVSVVASADATPTTPGVFTVSRPAADGATNMPLTVSFTLSGTAVAGTHYVRIPSCVTIPAGAASATLEIAAVREVAATTSLTLTLSGENHLPGDSPSATMSVTTVRAPAALVWSAGTSATELTDPANWTPLVPAIEENDTLSFTGDGTSAYRFTATNDMTVKSFAFANGASPAVVDLGGHTLSNDTVNTTGSFKQTGAGPLVLQNGTLAARTWSFASPELAMTNVFLVGNGDWMTTTLAFNNNNARYLFDNVTLRLCQSWYSQVTFKGADFAVDARNMVNVYPYYVPQLVIGGSNAALRFHGAETRLRCGLNMSGRDNTVTVSDGRLYGASGGTQGNITMTGTNLELVVTNTLGDRCESCIPNLDSATRCAIRVLKGGNYAIMRIDDKMTSSFAIDGCSNLIEVADGTLTVPTLRFGHRDGATFGGNELAVRGDEAVVTFGNGCYVGNIDQPPVTLSFAPGPNGFGGTAPVRQTNTGKNVFVATNTIFKVDARTLTRTRDHGRFALPLMSFRSTTQAETAFTAETLATFNKNLVSQPRGGKLSLETDGNYRVLTWNYDKHGTVLILR